MGNVASLFSGSRSESSAAHTARGMNPAYGLLIGETTPAAERESNERAATLRMAGREIEKAVQAEEAYRRALGAGLASDELSRTLRTLRAEARSHAAQAAIYLAAANTEAGAA